MENMIKLFVPLLGRILLSQIFILSGWHKITGFEQTAAYMASKGMVLVPVFLVLTILVELGGGLMLLLGWHARWAALALCLFLIPVTLIFHAFWSADPAQLQSQTINFMKNLSIMGGMLYVFAYGSGALGLRRD